MSVNQLSSLILIDKSVGLRADYLENAYTTQAYSRFDFYGWEARIAGDFSDEGVDTDGDGIFDYLEVQLPIEVRRSGTYTATATLDLADGSRINSSTYVWADDPGNQVVSLQFNGPEIALHNVDGPYLVTNLTIQGPLGLALFEGVLGSTGPYSYLDFEADSTAPVSTMTPLSPYTTTPSIELSWTGTDPAPSAGIAGYDLQYRVGSNGEWVDWLTETVLTSYRFGPFDPVTVQFGQTYYFRARAFDFAGNLEAYPGGDGDTHTTVVDELGVPLACNSIPEGFETGVPPIGWSVVSNEPTGAQWTTVANCGQAGNYTGGAGEAACASIGAFGTTEFDTELRTPVFKLAGVGESHLTYRANYQAWAGIDLLDLDLSTDAGATWTTILRWDESHGAFQTTPGETVTVDLTPWIGQADLMLRWRYYASRPFDWGWYAQVDDVGLNCSGVPTAVVLSSLDTSENSPVPMPAPVPLAALPAAAGLALGVAAWLRRKR